MKVESPCIQICTIVDDTCIGCHRTLDEISEWLSATDERKKEILRGIANE